MHPPLPRFIRDDRTSGKVIILLHGFLASSQYWHRLRPKLRRRGYRVITIDLLGFGRAPRPKDSGYGYEEHLAHVRKAIALLGLAEPFILGGHSMGALIASRYARESPEDISSLILLNPPLYRNPLQAKQALRATNFMYRFLLDSKYRDIGWQVIKALPGGSISGHSKQARERSLAHVIEQAELRDDLRLLQPRTLVVIGTRDRKEYLDTILKSVLSASVSVALERVSHHSPLLKPRVISHAIDGFID